MYCRKCGSKLAEDSCFCSKCGAAINAPNRKTGITSESSVQTSKRRPIIAIVGVCLVFLPLQQAY